MNVVLLPTGSNYWDPWSRRLVTCAQYVDAPVRADVDLAISLYYLIALWKPDVAINGVVIDRLLPYSGFTVMRRVNIGVLK